MQAVILAGGRGTRLRSVTSKPKALLEVRGRVLLDQLIWLCARHGVSDIVVLAGYKAAQIERHVKKARYPVRVTVVAEREPRGTAGALAAAAQHLQREFLVLYGDVYTNLDLGAMLAFHRKRKGVATLAVHNSSHPHDSTVVAMNGKGRIMRLIEKPGTARHGRMTNAALYVMKKGVVKNAQGDIAADLFPTLLAQGKSVYGYHTEEFLCDIGTPERYRRLRCRIAAFIDRDGTINQNVNLLSKPSQLRLLKGAAQGIRKLNEHGILAVIVTNQPVVARELVTEEGLAKIHERLLRLLAKQGARIDALYYCPHHPEKNHPEANNPKYRRKCACRKPGTDMIEQARKSFKIDLRHSFVIGDQTRDIKMGKNAGCRTILVRTGYGGKDGLYRARPDQVVKDLAQACRLIVENE